MKNILIGFYFTAKHQCQKTNKMTVNISHSAAKYISCVKQGDSWLRKHQASGPQNVRIVNCEGCKARTVNYVGHNLRVRGQKPGPRCPHSSAALEPHYPLNPAAI